MAIKSSGLDGWGYDTLTVTPPNAGPLAGRKIVFLGQTANTSASNVANQMAGTVSIPISTADATAITITNARITSLSLIFLQVKGSSGKKLMLDTVVPGTGSATFTVRTSDAAATTVACDVWYLIFN